MSAGFVRFMKKSMEIQTFKYYFAQNFCFISFYVSKLTNVLV